MSVGKKTVAKLDSSYMQQYEAHINRQKKRKQRLIRRLVVFSILILFIIGTMTTYHVKQRMIYAEKKEQYEQLEQELADLKKKEEAYKEEIVLLNNDEYVLEIARTNYFFSKKGELIFKIPDETPSY